MNIYSNEHKEDIIPKSLPIKIIKKNNKKIQANINNEEYLLDKITFNPRKLIPQSEWKTRLETRINSFDNLQIFIDN